MIDTKREVDGGGVAGPATKRMPIVRRREFLGVATTLAFGVAAGLQSAVAAPVSAGGAQGDEALILADRLLHAYPLRQSLAAIGDVYWQEAARQGHVCWPCLPDLLQEFLHHLHLSEAELRHMTPAAVRARVKSGTATDFSKARIVRVRGWLLGETEARLCAIAALRTA